MSRRKPEPVRQATIEFQRTLYRREDEETPYGKTWRSVEDGEEAVSAVLLLDMRGLAELMGRRAAGNTGGRSTALQGLVVARVLHRRRLPARSVP